MKVMLASVLLSLLVVGSSAISIGTKLERDFGIYTTMPTTTTEASAAGWAPLDGTCQAGLGIIWTMNGTDMTEKRPLWLYFTPAGQVSGVAVLFMNHLNDQSQNLINLGFIVPHYPGDYFVAVGFRSGAAACSSSVQALPLGDRLIVNPQGIAHSVPLTAVAAAAEGWVKGSCFAGMGTHWFKDLSSPGSMTWASSQLMPIVTMYDEESENPTGNINAIFFASTVVQQSILPPNTNQWEPIPLPNVLMCKNFCNSSCTFSGTSFYSTLHVYMNERSRVTCKGGCTLGCCDGASNQDAESRRLRLNMKKSQP